MPPQPYPYATGPKRPGAATGAGVLGIVSGGLGFIVFLGTITTLVSMQAWSRSGNYGNTDALVNLLGYLQTLGTLATAIALLVTGITFLKGNGYTVLFTAACLQAALTVLGLVISIINLNASGIMTTDPNGAVGGFVVGAGFRVLAGLGLAGTTIFLLRKPEVKQWAGRTA